MSAAVFEEVRLSPAPRRDPAAGFPCVRPGTATYTGCVGTDHCRRDLGTPRCLLGRWATERTPTAWQRAFGGDER